MISTALSIMAVWMNILAPLGRMKMTLISGIVLRLIFRILCRIGKCV
jgi:hypothetical protein